MSRRDAAVAAGRFGYGPKPGELDQIASDPRGWVIEQLSKSPERPEGLRAIPDSVDRAAQVLVALNQGADNLAQMMRQEGRRIYISDVAARTLAAARTEDAVIERLVHFWSNHFTVSASRPIVLPVALPFEQEAIRPHVLGRFTDMLLAVARHPAMLAYLDNAVSVGPNSWAGRRRDRGLNENLAREILELHTLGVDGGYTQDDVRQLALILTGWTVRRPQDGDPGRFRFLPAIHEPGDKRLLGVVYAEDGQAEGERALADLARHPSTARHIAVKLARHFIADQPPGTAVDRLAAAFQASDGDLHAVSRELVQIDAVWADPLPKFKSPNDLVISALRSMGGAPGNSEVGTGAVASLDMLGQAPFTAPSPAGWPDTAEAWATPEAMVRRVEWGLEVAQRIGGSIDPRRFVDWTIAPVAADDTLIAIDRAPSAEEGLALAFASPAFQRR